MTRSRCLAILLAGAAVALAACDADQSGTRGTVPTDAPLATPSAAASTGAPTTAPPGPGRTADGATTDGGTGTGTGRPGATTTVAIWLTRDGRIFPTSRTRPATVAVARLALNELIAGPTPAERAAGVRTGVPAATTFEITISDSVATVDLPAAFYAGGRGPARLRQAQVVYTLTQFPTVSRVGFQRAGDALSAPVGRADYADLLPAIVVTSPRIGQRVSSPIQVTGTANVYEATVSVRILDAAGAEIATTFTTATCGSGCRGSYSVSVAYRSPRRQPATVQVYEVSAADGARINVVNIPVVLTA